MLIHLGLPLHTSCYLHTPCLLTDKSFYRIFTGPNLREATLKVLGMSSIRGHKGHTAELLTISTQK